MITLGNSALRTRRSMRCRTMRLILVKNSRIQVGARPRLLAPLSFYWLRQRHMHKGVFGSLMTLFISNLLQRFSLIFSTSMATSKLLNARIPSVKMGLAVRHKLEAGQLASQMLAHRSPRRAVLSRHDPKQQASKNIYPATATTYLMRTCWKWDTADKTSLAASKELEVGVDKFMLLHGLSRMLRGSSQPALSRTLAAAFERSSKRELFHAGAIGLPRNSRSAIPRTERRTGWDINPRSGTHWIASGINAIGNGRRLSICISPAEMKLAISHAAAAKPELARLISDNALAPNSDPSVRKQLRSSWRSIQPEHLMRSVGLMSGADDFHKYSRATTFAYKVEKAFANRRTFLRNWQTKESPISPKTSLALEGQLPIVLRWHNPQQKETAGPNSARLPQAIAIPRTQNISAIANATKGLNIPVGAEVSAVAAQRTFAFDSSSLNRLTEEVIGRLERRFRSERERQGI